MESNENKNRPRITNSQWRLFFVVLVLGLAGLYFFALRSNGLNDSAALYVGLPVLIALGLSLTPKATSAVGATMKGLTIALLLAAPVLQEGYICVLLASPIFYGVAALIAWTIDSEREEEKKGPKLQVALITVLLALASLEGTHEIFTFERENQVESARIINADADSIREMLAQTPTFDTPRPFFIRIFPLPTSVQGSGIAIGDERKLHFVYNKLLFFNAHEGDTVFQIAESTDNYVRFDVAQDDSFLSHYLIWQSSEVFLEPISANQTKVTWRLSYQRKLDPIWYFGPLQRYAAGLTAETLIDNVADPTL